MRRLMREVKPTQQERLTLREVGDAYIAHVRDFLERKPSTIQDYEGILNRAERRLPKKTVDRYGASDIEGYVSAMKKAGRKPKAISNHLNFLHGLFAFAEKRGWASGNAVAEAERPRDEGADPDIRFIDLEELEALLRVVPRRRSWRGRATALPDRRDDRLAPGRVDSAALEGRRLEGEPDPCPPSPSSARNTPAPTISSSATPRPAVRSTPRR